MSLSVADRKIFALSVGTTIRYLTKILYIGDDSRLLGPKICTQIEIQTKGEITRKDLRPDDWQEIWPELKITNQAA